MNLPLPNGLRPQFLQAVLIVVAGFWVYWPAAHGDFLWDDNVLITSNPLMKDPNGLWEIWSEPGILMDYYPITFTVQRFEWELWGMNPLGYHLTNIVLHIASALLVWRLFSKLGLRLAWWGGLLFAVHPVMVESVAWIAELKNTLSLPPLLLAMCAWIDYDREGKRSDYLAALGLFLVALLCKIAVVMLPLVILLYVWWKRDRIGWSDLKASAPFFILSLVFGMITIKTGVWAREFNHVEPQVIPAGGALGRLVLAGGEIAFDFSKSVLPIKLLPIYPKWTIDPSLPLQYLPWVVLIGVIAWLWVLRRSWGKHVLFGLGFFLINLLPCPGFIPAPNMGYAWVMDHFLYLPIIGLLGLVVAGLGRLDEELSRFACFWLIGTAAMVTVLLAFGSHVYAGMFSSSETLWTYAIERNPESWMAHANLGVALGRKNQIREAMEQFEMSLEIEPTFVSGHYDLGTALGRLDRLPESIREYETVIKLDPTNVEAYYDLGNILVRAHRPQDAADRFEKALQLNPRHAKAHYALGNLLSDSNHFPEAIDQYEKSLLTDPNNGAAHDALGNALLKTNQLQDAVDHYELALQLNPRDAEAMSNLGVISARVGRFPAALQLFETALQIDPNNLEARNNLGSVFLVTGRFQEAIAQYQAALRIKPDFASAQKNLARAQAMQKAQEQAPPSSVNGKAP
jgi:tetratricopeptide (TPR) repeat protein